MNQESLPGIPDVECTLKRILQETLNKLIAIGGGAWESRGLYCTRIHLWHSEKFTGFLVTEVVKASPRRR